MKKALITLILLAAAGVTVWQFRTRFASSGGPEGARPRPAVAVETAPIRRTTISDLDRFAGSLQPRSYFVVAPKIAGRLRQLYVDIGDTVKPGQLIAVLDAEEYLQAIEQARAELAVAQANLEQARSLRTVALREFERIRTLKTKDVSSESELDTKQAQYEASDAAYKVALAQIEQRNAALKVAEIRLSYTRIEASWRNGSETRYVGERFADEGAMLMANSPIVSIIDLASLKAVVHVTERDYSGIKRGQEATLETDALPGMVFKGTIARIAPLLKESSREARVEIEVPNPDLLMKPGMFVRVQITFETRAGVIVVPTAALAKRGGRTGVFLADAQARKARFIPAEIGISTPELTEILRPELDGEVITLGHHLLEDGSDIVLPQTPADTPAPKPETTRDADARPGTHL